MNILIVGPGAIGTLFGARLAAAGNAVSALDHRPERAALIEKQGFVVEREGRAALVGSLAVSTIATANVPPVSFVIITLKAYQTESALPALEQVLKNSPAAVVLSLQNGVGNVEILERVTPAGQLIAGTTAHGATALGPGRVRHAGIGDTTIGRLDGKQTPDVARLSEILNGAGMKTTISSDITSVLWTKLLVNVGINPLTAIFRVKNGRLLEMPAAVELMRALVEEAAAVARAAGIRVAAADPVALVEDVARRTAENISSMHRDVLEERPTEIDFITGVIVRKGAELGIPTPANETIYHIIKSISGERKEAAGNQQLADVTWQRDIRPRMKNPRLQRMKT